VLTKMNPTSRGYQAIFHLGIHNVTIRLAAWSTGLASLGRSSHCRHACRCTERVHTAIGIHIYSAVCNCEDCHHLSLKAWMVVGGKMHVSRMTVLMRPSPSKRMAHLLMHDPGCAVGRPPTIWPHHSADVIHKPHAHGRAQHTGQHAGMHANRQAELPTSLYVPLLCYYCSSDELFCAVLSGAWLLPYGKQGVPLWAMCATVSWLVFDRLSWPQAPSTMSSTPPASHKGTSTAVSMAPSFAQLSPVYLCRGLVTAKPRKWQSLSDECCEALRSVVHGSRPVQ
jgi:hypothetical protein